MDPDRDDRAKRLLASLLPSGEEGATTPDEGALRLLYDELRGLAQRQLARNRNESLQATELVHEAWMRMRSPEVDLGSEDEDELRRRFLGTAARAMRWILVDRARRRSSAKRGGGWGRITLSDCSPSPSIEAVDVLDLERALAQLEGFRPRLARVAELRLFAGLSAEDVADALSISLTTSTDEWALAKALLSEQLRDAT